MLSSVMVVIRNVAKRETYMPAGLKISLVLNNLVFAVNNMPSKKRVLTVLVGLTLIFPFSLNAALAQLSPGLKTNVETKLRDVTAGIYQTTEPPSLEVIIQNAINWVLGFLMLITIIVIIIGGFNWMTAGGQEDKVEKGKKWIINGVIGLIIILAAFVLTLFVFKVWEAITGGTTGPPPVGP